MMSEANSLEAEVKFLLADLAAMREQLLRAGATLKRPRIYERNVVYDNAWDGLMRGGKLLRLRQDDQARLTFKGSAENIGPTEVKIREELEMVVENFDTAAAILERIGFTPKRIYEKYRETFQLGAVEAVLDEMPFGLFLELEGEEGDIKAAAAQLGLDWSSRILENYLYLLTRLNDHHGLDIQDITFANFDQLTISIQDLYK